jgi:FKBP-type peptidyl-prolyl cis-trans isomerase
MATSKGQRIGIGIILAVTVLGTVGSFAVMILSQQDATKVAAQKQKDLTDYQAKYKEYQAKVSAQASELSTKYYPTFSQYAGRVAAFDLNENNKTLKTEDITAGDGEEIKDDTVFAAYYIGWNPSGKIFDQSIDGSKLKSPLPIAGGLAKASLITGWKEGHEGHEDWRRKGAYYS